MIQSSKKTCEIFETIAPSNDQTSITASISQHQISDIIANSHLEDDFKHISVREALLTSNKLFGILKNNFTIVERHSNELAAALDSAFGDSSVQRTTNDKLREYKYYSLNNTQIDNPLYNFLNQYLNYNDECDSMKLYVLYELLKNVPDTPRLLQAIYNSRNEILNQVKNKVLIPCLLIYHHKFNIENEASLKKFKEQLMYSSFDVTDSTNMSIAEIERVISNGNKNKSIVIIIIDEHLNEELDESVDSSIDENASPVEINQQQATHRSTQDYRRIGRRLYFEYLNNECENKRFFTFLSSSLEAENMKYPWLLTEKRDEKPCQFKIYMRPLSIPRDATYPIKDMTPNAFAISNYLRNIYKGLQ